MRYLILSDIHGNWQAFDAVLEAAAPEKIDRVLVLGDLVGYGAAANRVVERVNELTDEGGVVRGNHDKVIVGIDSAETFNWVAREAVRWTAERLSDENAEYLRQLPRGPLKINDRYSICHGSPIDEDEYLLSGGAAERSFRLHPADLTFFGHTHVPTVFSYGADGINAAVLEGEEHVLDLTPGVRYLINPGSVGQPRDRDPRAGYVIFDEDRQTVSWRRLEYAVAEAQDEIIAAGLPHVLAYRLAAGL